MDEVAQAIRQDPGRDWSVAEMAAQATLSRAQFTRRFVAQHGRAPAQFVIQARIDRAHQLLAESGMTVTQTAAALGYTDVPYFSRQYKQRTGRSPRDDATGARLGPDPLAGFSTARRPSATRRTACPGGEWTHHCERDGVLLQSPAGG